MLKIKQYICRHKEFEQIATHRSALQNLYKCKKCDLYQVIHYGTGMRYYSKTPHIDGWLYF